MEIFLEYLLIAVCGLTGVFLRFFVDRWFAPRFPAFPMGTFTINVLGSFLAGLFFTLFDRGILASELRVGILVGFLGGFTTFSAYSLQSAGMIENGKYLVAFSYWAFSPIAGLGAALLGLKLGRVI